MKISYSIISRGSMVVGVGNKKITISGELIFNPPKFYADINALTFWDSPNENETISELDKKSIIEYITKDSLEEGKTEIEFD